MGSEAGHRCKYPMCYPTAALLVKTTNRLEFLTAASILKSMLTCLSSICKVSYQERYPGRQSTAHASAAGCECYATGVGLNRLTEVRF